MFRRAKRPNGQTTKTASSSKGGNRRNATAILLTIALILGGIPTQAIAEAIDILPVKELDTEVLGETSIDNNDLNITDSTRGKTEVEIEPPPLANETIFEENSFVEPADNTTLEILEDGAEHDDGFSSRLLENEEDHVGENVELAELPDEDLDSDTAESSTDFAQEHGTGMEDQTESVQRTNEFPNEEEGAPLLRSQAEGGWNMAFWKSFSGWGSELSANVGTVRLGDRVYVNYRITDSDGNVPNRNTSGFKGYTFQFNTYYPDGSLRYSPEAKHDGDGWVSTIVDKTGQWKTTLQISNTTGYNDVATTYYTVKDIIDSHPSDQSAYSGDTVTFRVSAASTFAYASGGTGWRSLQYQWYRWTPSSSMWSAISGANSPTYSVTATSSNSGSFYYCAVTNGDYTSASNYAKLTTKYTVSYNANGGSGAPSSQTKTHGDTLILSSAKPTRSGYTFVGWSSGGSSASYDYSPGGSYSNNANLALYAVWRKTISVIYYANGGSGAPSTQNTTVYNSTTSASFTISTTRPTRTGYTFLGWSRDESAAYPDGTYDPGDSVALSASTQLYAVWRANLYMITYDAYGGTVSPVSKSVTYNDSYGTLPTPVRFGYSFGGWYTSPNGGSRIYATTTVATASNHTLYAHWTPNPSIAACVITVSPTNCTYDGTAKKPAATVKDGSKTLKLGTDYTVTYKNNVNAGNGSVTITGTNDYAGSSVTKTFLISPKPISLCTVTLSKTSYTYDGAAKKPTATVKDGSRELVQGVDYNVTYKSNVNAGTATASIAGKGNYAGSYSATFKISKANLSGATVAGIPNQGFTDNAITPNPTVTLGKKTLLKDTDYTVTYLDNDSVGTATLTITGKGNYSGSKQASFQIVQKSISSCIVTLSQTSYTYDGVAKKPTVTVKDGSKTLVTGVHYTVKYGKNTNAGTATVIVTGKGNYSGSKKITFTISAKALSRCTTTLSPSSYTYDGKQKNPTITVKDGNKNLASGTDYDVTTPGGRTNAGTYTYVVTGKGNYTGSLNTSLNIFRLSIKKAQISSISKQIENKDELPITPAPKVVLGGKTLKAGKDYTLSYKKNTSAGTATVTAKGKGNYSGSVSAKFTILANVQLCKAKSNSPRSIKTAMLTRVVYRQGEPGEKALVENKDYAVCFALDKSDKNTMVATITGIGRYGGTAKFRFKLSG